MGYKSVLSIALVAGLLSTTAHFALAKNSDTVIEKLDSVLFVDPTKDFGGSGTHKDPASMAKAEELLADEEDKYTEAYIIDGTQEERDDLAKHFSKKSGGQVLDNSRDVKVYGTGVVLGPNFSPEAVAHVLKSPKTHKPHGQKRRDQSQKVVKAGPTPIFRHAGMKTDQLHQQELAHGRATNAKGHIRGLAGGNESDKAFTHMQNVMVGLAHNQNPSLPQAANHLYGLHNQNMARRRFAAAISMTTQAANVRKAFLDQYALIANQREKEDLEDELTYYDNLP